MGKEKLKNRKGTLLITNKLGKFERLNLEELKILINGTVQGLAPVSVIQKRKKVTLQVEQAGWIPLTAYLQTDMDGETALTFILNTVRIAYDCERYGLRVDSLCWDWSRIFVDSQGSVHMIYWSMTTLEQSVTNAQAFYYSFCGILAASDIGQSISTKYARFFYQRDYFELHLFYQLMQDILDQWRSIKYKEQLQRQREREKEKIPASRPDTQYTLASGWLVRAGKEERITLDQDRTMIGRNPHKCKIVLTENEGISRVHAIIENKDGQFYLTDLGSRNGTFLRGDRLQPHARVALCDGDFIKFYNVSFVFHKQDLNQTISIPQLRRS